jgi:hypothetical protein
MEKSLIDSNREVLARREARLRWVAACAGLVTLSSVVVTMLCLPFPVMLIVGAAIAGRWPRTGQWLMGISACVLSVLLLPVYVLLLPEVKFVYTDILILLIDIGWIGTLILLPLCILLLADVFKKRQALRRIV